MATETTDHSNRPRDGRGRWVRTMAGRERDTTALEMKSNGRTYQEIADTLGYSSKGDAHAGVQRALAEVQLPRVEDARRRMLEEMDVVRRKVFDVLEQAGAATGDEGGPVMADALKAAAELNRIWATERGLLGLDAPTKTQLEVTTVDFTIDGIPGDQV